MLRRNSIPAWPFAGSCTASKPRHAMHGCIDNGARSTVFDSAVNRPGPVERIGIAKLRSIIVDNSEGIAPRLDEEIAQSKAAYKDPWKEAYMPAASTQFSSELRVIS